MNCRSKRMISLVCICFALSGCETKQTPHIDLSVFLPSAMGTYVYKVITKNSILNSGTRKSKDMYEEKNIHKRVDNCVDIDTYTRFYAEDISGMPKVLKQQVQDGKLYNGSIGFCTDHEKIFYRDGTILYQAGKDWSMEIQSVSASEKEKTIQADCHFIALSDDVIMGERRKVLHTQCQYEIAEHITESIDWFLAEGVGLYKIVMTMDDENTHSHSTIERVLMKVDQNNTGKKAGK